MNEQRQADSPPEMARAAAMAENAKTRAFLGLALDRFHAAEDYEAPGRKESLDDFNFSIGKQWPEDILASRHLDQRPCLTMDHLNQSIKLVTNQLREDRPAMQINPVGNGATREVAKILQGIIRHIEVASDSEVVYDTVGDHMVRGGFGFLRVRSEYIDDKSFDQDIIIEYIQNPFTVFTDPAAKAPGQLDARFRFIIEDIPWGLYKSKYPKATIASWEAMQSVGIIPGAWASKDAIRVAEYYYLDNEFSELCQLETGEVKPRSEVTETDQVVQSRQAERIVVRWALINAAEILDERELPGKAIPIVSVIGDEVNVDGKPFRAGLVRNAKDPQRMYNYQCSAATEQVALAPRAPYVGAVGQFKSKPEQWKQLNTRNFPYLEYDPISAGGQPVGPPQRNVAEPPIQATVMLINQAGMDLKASMGIYDASLGQPGPEQSGKAILLRQKQGDRATLNFSDNIRRSLRQLGRVLLPWIQTYYDVPRLQRIINPDNSVRHVGVFNSQNDVSPEEAMLQLQQLDANLKEVYDIGVGTYDVVFSTGASYETRRQEAVESIMALVNSYPNLMQIAGDLLVANMDWPYADEIAKRLKKTIPPNLLESDGTPEAKIAMLSSQLQQMGQQHQLLTAALSEANEIIKGKKLEMESKERIALNDNITTLIQTQLKAGLDGAMETMKAEMQAIQSRLDMLHENMSIDEETGKLAPAPAPAEGTGSEKV